MKIIHIADIHWRGLTRHKEYTQVFKSFFKKAKSLEPDVIYVGGDIVHSKTQGISPELISCLCWWFEELSKISPVHVILGNHDGLIHNKDREDAILPILSAINNDNIHVYKQSGTYSSGIPGFNWCVLSCFDDKNYHLAKPVKGDVNIALYHGCVRGSLTDIDFQLDGEGEISIFDDYEFALLGDIHKRQFLNDKKTVAYCGSTIQQNFGETNDKGFLFWDIRSKDDFDVTFHQLDNSYEFVTVKWQGTVKKTFDYCQSFSSNARFRIASKSFIPHADLQLLQRMLKKDMNASEVVFKVESRLENSQVNAEKIKSINLRSASVQKKLFREYYSETDIVEKEWKILDVMIDEFLSSTQSGTRSKNISWEINEIKFSNTFSYGEDNHINFKTLKGITGIFGKNAKGKSSIIGSLMYGLYNTTDRGSISNLHVINTRKNNCKVEIDLSINGMPSRIVRSSQKKQNRDGVWAPTSLQFYNLDNQGNVIEDRTEEQRRETEKILRNIIGTSDEFLMTSLASQGEMNTFIKEKASTRKKILSAFLDLNVYEELYEVCKNKSSNVKSELKIFDNSNWDEKIDNKEYLLLTEEDNILKINNEIIQINRRISDINKVISDNNHSDDMFTSFDLKEELSKNSRLKKVKTSLNIEIDKNNKILKNHTDKLNNFKISRNEYDLEEILKMKVIFDELHVGVLNAKNTLSLSKNDLKVIKASVRKLDLVPCGDKFPTCKFIKDSHSNKKKLKKKEDEVLMFRGIFNDLKDKFDDLSSQNIDKIIERINHLDTETNTVTKELNEVQSNIDKLKFDLIKIDERINLSNDKASKIKLNIKDDNEELVLLKKSLKKLNQEINRKDTERVTCIKKVGMLTADIALMKKQRKKYNVLSKQNKMYDIFLQAVSKRGIPLLLINKLLPNINYEIAKILSEVVGFTVELSSSVEDNSMDVYIDYGDSKRIIELASGMEKMMASLAIRVALINISSLAKTNILIIDEGFGALDETSLQACNSLLQSLKKYFQNILVISHVDSVKDAVDHNLEIIKKGLDSYVNHK